MPTNLAQLARAQRSCGPRPEVTHLQAQDQNKWQPMQSRQFTCGRIPLTTLYSPTRRYLIVKRRTLALPIHERIDLYNFTVTPRISLLSEPYERFSARIARCLSFGRVRRNVCSQNTHDIKWPKKTSKWHTLDTQSRMDMLSYEVTSRVP